MSRAQGSALITGASAGIGLELAHVFARNGFDLIVVARRQAELEALAERCQKEYAAHVHVLPMDLLAPNAPANLVEQLDDEGLPVDVLVNNAGLMELGDFAEIDIESHERLMQLNVVVLTSLTRLLLPGMLRRDSGRILNVASTSSFQPVPSMALYAASKAFVLSLSESLSEELKESGVTVTALCPGITKTAMYERSLDNHGMVPMIPGFFLSEVGDVAREGYEACMEGRAVVVPGLPNRLLASAVQLYPRWLVRSVGGLIGRQSTRD
ncbi:MAG: SDR family oxidoreductase [bacterium]|nr:SDR family oxidoreductase [bacterium]MCP5067332.1 SDR family oxidoreductase [bacterium]